MLKQFIIFLAFLSIQVQAATISVQGPCSPKTLVSGHINQKGLQTVSELSYQFFSDKAISVRGNKYNVDKIWDLPQDKFRQYQSGQSTYYFGWCYAVNGKVPKETINNYKVKDSDHIQWFLGFMNYSQGRWNNSCQAAYTLASNPFCQKKNLKQSTSAKQSPEQIHFNDPTIKAWATKVESFDPGFNLTENFADSSKALEAVNGDPSDTVSLGEGGEIVLSFNGAIFDGNAYDFVVFENAFIPDFLELAYVEVSSNGTDFARFPSKVQDLRPIGPYGLTDPAAIEGLAGKFGPTRGQAFDLRELQQLDLITQGVVDLENIRFIKIVDIIGDGRSLDSQGQQIYDPFPTQGSAGFDLAGVAVIHIR